MGKMKKVIGPVILILIISIVTYYFLKHKEEKQIYYSGNIEARTTDLSFQTMGKLVELKFDEGQFIKKGELAAKIDDREFISQKNINITKYNATKSRIEQLKTSVELQERVTDAQIQQAKASLYIAQTNLKQLHKGSRNQEIQQAEQIVKLARIKKENSNKEYNRVKALFEKEAISQQSLDNAKTVLDSNTKDLLRLQESLGLVKEGPRIEQVQMGEGSVMQAEATLKSAMTGPLSAKKIYQEIDSFNLDLKNLKEMVNLYDIQLSKTKLYSPTNGVVISKNVESGEVVSPGTPILTIADLDNIWLKIYIGTTDLGKIKLGQKVKIKTDSYPDKFYEGKISFISSEAEFTPKIIQTQKERVKQVYRVKVDIKNVKQELKSGMPADAYLE